MTAEGAPADDLLRLAEAIRKQDGQLSPLTAGIVAALWMGLAADSRSFANIFGIPHALVLREINLMDQTGGPVTILRRDARTHILQSRHDALGIASPNRCPRLTLARELLNKSVSAAQGIKIHLRSKPGAGPLWREF
jgi:hypothetical protein